ncbi:MAG: LPD38 domain-containing protein, partial [Alphaproteobacteria bacterium]
DASPGGNEIRAGATEAEAALLSKESTVNFDRVGYAGQWVNVHTMFWNAGFEGSMNFIRAARRSKKFRRVLGGLVAASAAHYVMMRGLMGQGPDDEYEYAAIPAHRRHRTAILPIGDTYFQMPLAYGLNVFWAMGQEAMAMAMGDKTPEESAYDLFATALQAFNPVPSGPTFGQLVAPSVMDPFIQAGENVTWYGGDITSPFLLERNLPDHLKTPDASRAAKEATQAIFNLLGGDAMKPSPMDDVRDFTPDNFDHIMNSVFGSLGRDIWRTIDKVYREDAAPARKERSPVLGSFIYQTPELPVQRNFDDIREQTGRVVTMLDEIRKTDPDRFAQQIERHALEYGHGKAFEQQHRDLADVRRLMNAAETEEQRQEYAQVITEVQASLIRAYEADLLKAAQQKPANQGEARPVTLKEVMRQLEANKAALTERGYKVD